MGKTVFLKMSEAKWIERMEFHPIYEFSGKFFVGLGYLLRLAGEDAEYCEEYDSLAEAEAACAKIHDWGEDSDPLKETLLTDLPVES
jgi:hypothetical protein